MNKKGKFIFIIICAALLVGVIIYAINDQAKNDNLEGREEKGLLTITEVMPSNKGVLPDEKGEYPDWIEVYNPTDDPINLSGYGLSDDNQSYAKWVFPNVELAPKSYYVVYASGTASTSDTGGYPHAGFKLKSAGETVYLTNTRGQLVDSLEFGSVGANQSYAKNLETGEWAVTDMPTPGFENTEAGYAAFKDSLKVENSPIIVTEVMSSNGSTLADSLGLYEDWIEIYNRSDETVNLEGYGLSDDPDDMLAWKFPAVELGPGEYLVVFASGQDIAEGDELHTNFRLSSYKETVVLANQRGLELDSVSVPTLKSDTVYAREVLEDGSYGDNFGISATPTPGLVNTMEGFQQFEQSSGSVQTGAVSISEVITGNSQYAQESNGEYYDLIELYNSSSQSVNLSGYSLTTNTQNPAMWRFPEGTTIEAGGYLLVYASGLGDTEEGQEMQNLHTNFRLSGEGEVLALFNSQDQLQDRLFIPSLPQNVSYGKMDGQAGSYYFATPTPLAANQNPSLGYAVAPELSLEGGLYGGTQTVSLSSKDGEIYYTLDGSTPTTSSQKYTGALTISETTKLRARVFKDGYLPSTTTTATYIINDDHTLPVVSLVTDDKYLFSKEEGIYYGEELEHGVPDPNANYYQDWEVPAHFEYMKDGKTVFSQDIGLKIFGAYSRSEPQKSFSIFARSEYGEDTLAYPFFDDLPYQEYKSIVLRCSGQDRYMTKVRDVTMTSLMGENTDLAVQAYTTCVVYLNGEYWGVYHIREKINKYYLSQHYNVPIEDIDLLVGNGTALVGSNEDYKKMLEFLETHSLKDPENYEYIKTQMDVENYMDYVIAEIYFSNSDLGNIKFWRDRNGGKWQWILYDLDWGMFKLDRDGVAAHLNPEGMGVNLGFSTLIFRSLIQNDEWKQMFLERFAYHLENTFSAEKVIARADEITATLIDELPREKEKFGGTMRNYELHMQRFKEYAEKKPTVILYELQTNLGLSDDEMIEIFGKTGKSAEEVGWNF